MNGVVDKTDLLDYLLPLIREIVDLPIQHLAGCDLGHYTGIELIRLEAASRACAETIERYRQHHGDAMAECVRRYLEPVRLELIAKFPASSALLEAATWPAIQRH